MSLADDLRAAVRGEVRFDSGSRALYAADASNYRQVPIGVVVPCDADDVVAAVEVCRRHGSPLLPRGGGTGMAGQSVNAAVVLDCSKRLRGIVELDPERRLARVEPGVVLDRLRDAAEEHGLTFAPDPATHDRCTLGGMIGNNSCGAHSVMGGKTAENVVGLEVLTYDGLRLRVGRTDDDELERRIGAGGREGEIYRRLRDLRDRYADLVRERYPDIPRRVSGFNLDELLPERGFDVAKALVGSEGTCVTVLEATLRLVPSPPCRTLVVLGYPDGATAADHAPEVLARGPIALEGFDDLLVAKQRKKGIHKPEIALLPEGGGWLLVEFGGATREEADGRARDLVEAVCGDGGPSARILDDPREEQMIWRVRESGLGATARVPGEAATWPGWEDAAVPPARLGSYLRALRKLIDGYGYEAALYGHFGQGCVHTRIDFDLRSAEGVARFRSFVEDGAELVLAHGGSLSGEHGDGQARAELLPRMFGPELVEAFREFKAIWDPAGKMNPGKVVDPAPLDAHLRFGAGYRPAQPKTRFAFLGDDGSLAQATTRCVGVGLCRRTDGGTMCPSYMVTLEERHSTRGRARLLHEMLVGEVVQGGWRSEEVKEALDLCLACKGCRTECPVNVDMATYKAEFLSHYYEGRVRPPAAYAFGLIDVWARLVEPAPWLANLVTQTPGLRDLAKAAVGIAPERRIPPFAARSFRRSVEGRRPRNPDGPRVILWADTFNDHFHPGTARAALDVLERLGYRVELPRQRLCCGRPLYDWGMLGRARRLLKGTLRTLRPELAAGVPVVGLEPSCIAVFRDELTNLLPNDEDAKRLARQSFVLSEFLEREEVELPRLERRALVHGHCHHKTVLGMDAELAVLDRLGLEVESPETGCCGMAGSFGFERGDRYEVSVKAGERVLLPAVRAAAADTLVVANGFSCREQIAQCTDRRALHLAEVLELAFQAPPAHRDTSGV